MNLTLSSHELKSLLTFQTSCGACNLVELYQFLLAIEKLEYSGISDKIRVPKLSSPKVGPIEYSDLPEDSMVKELIIPTKHIYNDVELKSVNQFSLEQEVMKFLEFEFIKMLAKKKPDYIPKNGELSMEMIQAMAEMYAKEFGSEPMMGIELPLNDYQKFFSIASPKDFRFIFGKSPVNAATRGALYTAADERWILAPFKKSVFRKEAAESQRYHR